MGYWGVKRAFGGPLTPKPPGFLKMGGFFHNFSKVLENFRPKTRPFFRFFQFPGGVPVFFFKIGVKMTFGGSFGAPNRGNLRGWGFFGPKRVKMTPKWPFWGVWGPSDPLFRGPWGPYQHPPFWGVFWPLFPLKSIWNWPLFRPFMGLSLMKMLSFYPKIPEIWLPQTQKWLFFFPITQ